ncbi:MAG: GNAT family N-acetyltransferase [Acutalibacteraceae bacterium]
MSFELIKISENDLKEYKSMMQEAFQKGFECRFGKTDKTVLPEKDIDRSLRANGAAAYKAVVDGETVGGAIVVIDEETQHNSLDLLFVKSGNQSKGIGKSIWFAIEKLYPETKAWKTCTPYFEKRNIHFYVNVCGFHIVEFFNEKHPMPDTPEDFIGDGNEGMFEFVKEMKPTEH